MSEYAVESSNQHHYDETRKAFLTEIEVATANHRPTICPTSIVDLTHALKENFDCIVYARRKKEV